jgi:hypothetical protein
MGEPPPAHSDGCDSAARRRSLPYVSGARRHSDSQRQRMSALSTLRRVHALPPVGDTVYLCVPIINIAPTVSARKARGRAKKRCFSRPWSCCAPDGDCGPGRRQGRDWLHGDHDRDLGVFASRSQGALVRQFLLTPGLQKAEARNLCRGAPGACR